MNQAQLETLSFYVERMRSDANMARYHIKRNTVQSPRHAANHAKRAFGDAKVVLKMISDLNLKVEGISA